MKQLYTFHELSREELEVLLPKHKTLHSPKEESLGEKIANGFYYFLGSIVMCNSGFVLALIVIGAIKGLLTILFDFSMNPFIYAVLLVIDSLITFAKPMIDTYEKIETGRKHVPKSLIYLAIDGILLWFFFRI